MVMPSYPTLCTTSRGTVEFNRQITDGNGNLFPHKCDIYIPNSKITNVCVFLHGGGGTKGQFAAQLHVGYYPYPLVNWTMLSFWQTIAIFPQGQACNGVYDPTLNPLGVTTPTAFTWFNWFMYSGVDDMAFLTAMSSYITGRWGSVGKNLCGHSSGGIMCARVWREKPTLFSHYCSSSGPAATHYLSQPVVPKIRRPLLLDIGALDDKLMIKDGPAGPGDHFYDQILQQNPDDWSKADCEFPAHGTHMGPWYDLQQMAAADNQPPVQQSSGVFSTDAFGNPQGITTWKTGSQNQIWLRRLEAANHDVPSHEAALGGRLVNQWMGFIATN